MHAGESGDNWLTPELAKQLGARGKTIVAKLAGFHSLHAVKLEQADPNSYDIQPTKIGDVVFTAKGDDEALTLTLQTAAGKTIHREQIDAYSERNPGGPDRRHLQLSAGDGRAVDRPTKAARALHRDSVPLPR